MFVRIEGIDDGGSKRATVWTRHDSYDAAQSTNLLDMPLTT